jgi:hypothetical protein
MVCYNHGNPLNLINHSPPVENFAEPITKAAECGNPRYILDLLLSVIHVSTQTMEIIERLPKLDFREEKDKPSNESGLQ